MLSDRGVVNRIVNHYNRNIELNPDSQPKKPMDMDKYYARMGDFLDFLNAMPFRKEIELGQTMTDVGAYGKISTTGSTFTFEKEGHYRWYATFFVNGYFVSQLYVHVDHIINPPNYVKLLTEEQKDAKFEVEYKRVTRAAIKLEDSFDNNTKVNTIKYAVKCLDKSMVFDQQASKWVE